jgi:hypothetical protein
MRLGRIGSEAILALVAGLLVCAAHAQYRPEVPVLYCAHEGEPVPQVPGAVFQYLWPPEIDGAGNVLFSGYMAGPGIGASNNEGIWYGQPGAMSLVARDGWPAPDLPGVVYSSVSSVGEAASENGWIVFTAYISGSGVTPDVNDKAVFCGPVGDFHLVKRTGSAVPEVGPGVTLSGAANLGACISDNGVLCVYGELAGASLPPTATHRVWWIGPRGGLQLAVWEGMPVQGCPECEPGVYLLGAGDLSFNDAGEVAFEAMLEGPGIHYYDNKARFIGPPDGLTIMQRTGDLVPQFGPGIEIVDFGGVWSLNASGDQVNRVRVYGPGVTTANDWALVGGETEPSTIIAREGDPAPEAGEGTYKRSVSTPFINNQHRALYLAGFAGPGVDPSEGGIYFGPYADAALIIREGDPAGYFPPGSALHQVGGVYGTVAMNDTGDFDAITRVQDAAGEIVDVLWLWRGLTAHYVPLLATGAQVSGRTVTLADFHGQFWTQTGGGDGMPQSFNDQRQLATLLDFTDGTSGIYRIGPPLLGDTDGDGQVSAAELLTFASCAAGPGGSVAPGCEALDLNLDATIDLKDLALLQAMVGEQR